ncbi:alpha-L-rhamnosidase C-terminal domain-containing protein [Paenibacillus sp. HGF5]|uniref:alpha-L-rhamnosidase C-terminal domain-containing protein n=1 Tax=Paenibacillus sp. HGF5 TaxID=908341 RepID=UPI00020727B0|nr:alpha-L-rhamnosidase C-terminal domain-containing protein [Paenibacillus sp. HGF5]EGG34237.1 bacterial alpha-L-rhamnosidase [Paenibacillus sp. HGF5]
MNIHRQAEKIPSWIWHRERAGRRHVVLEKSFVLHAAVEQLEMRIACTGEAEIRLNDAVIGHFPEHARHTSAFYPVEGLPGGLEPGAYTIRIELRNTEPMPMHPINMHLHDRSVGCIAYLSGSEGLWLATDDTWETGDGPAEVVCVWGEEPFGDLDHAPPWFIAGGYGDIAVEPVQGIRVMSAAGVEAVSGIDGVIQMKGTAGGRIVLGEVESRNERHIFYHLLKQGEWKERRTQQKELDLSRMPKLLLELPHELNVRMQVTNHGDSEIGLLWNGAESLQELRHYDGCMTEWLAIPPGSPSATNPQGMRYVQIYVSGDDGGTFHIELRLEAAGAALNQVGQLQTDNDLMQRIYDVSVHTSRVCHQIGLWDGIKRDRLNWAYDIYLAAKTEYSLWDDYSVLKRSLRELGRTPYGYWMNNLPSYTLWWVSSIWDYYFETGDREFVWELREDLQRHIAWVKANADPCSGIFMPDAKEAHSFIEWSPMGASESWACLNAIYGMTKSQMKRLADYMPELGLHWDEPQAELKEEQFIGPSYALLTSVIGIKSGYVEEDSARRFLLDYRLGDPLTPLSAYWLAECYSEYGMHERAWAVIATVWGTMLDAGATTFWEGIRLTPSSDIHHALTTYTAYDSYRMSLCHSWSSTPVVWIARYVLGIRALEPGYARIAFEPHAIGGLTAARGVIPSPRGLIQVEWKLEHGRMIKSARIGEAELAGRA